MNRNVLKVIAVISMLIDHIGLFFVNNNFVMRAIGRLAFPIFAFFIAEGLKHTHSRKQYVINLLICAVISQIPYAFLHNFYNLNILFTFLVAILCIFLIENYKKHDTIYLICLILIGLSLFFSELFGVFDYGIFGVLLLLAFYFIKDKELMFYAATFLCVIMTINPIRLMFFGGSQINIVQLFSIIGLFCLMLYNGKKGKLNLKWAFYVFYPLHLAVLLVLKLVI